MRIRSARRLRREGVTNHVKVVVTERARLGRNSVPTPLTHMHDLKALASAAMIASALASTGFSGEQTFRSGPARVALIELFTSEGCSSCPPAEAWLGELRQDSGLWREFVPVAFHVSYWDRLGWRDELASKAFTDREYAYAAAWNASSVYTPCFARNGLEWRPRDLQAKRESQPGDAGHLTLTWDSAERTCRVTFTPAASGLPRELSSGLSASIALLGGGIVSDVRKGENAGRKLQHEFVALQFETLSLKLDGNGSWSGFVSVPPRADVKAQCVAIAGWVHGRNELMPVQATGGWLDAIPQRTQ
jgi:hypothetical protein